jgi:hypothetical protein
MPNTIVTPSRADLFTRSLRIILKLFGVLFLLVGLALFGREIRFGQSALSAPGTIIDVRVTENADGPNYVPVVEFSPQDGRVVHFQGTSTSPAPVKGTPVKVLYDIEKPEQARIDSFVQRWLFPTIFTPVGLVLILIGTGWRTRARS